MALDASVSFATFKSPTQNYIEVYLHIVGKTVEYQKLPDERLHAAVKVVILFKQGEQIIKFDNYNLQSPYTTWSQDFIDLKRYSLDNGTYQLSVSVEDLNRPENVKTYAAEFKMDYRPDVLQQSDIQLLAGFRKEAQSSSFEKMGLHLEPLPGNWYHKNTSQLSFYHEIYQSDTQIGDDFFISYAILPDRKEEPINPILIAHKRLEPAPVVPVLLSMDISKLPNGNYVLKVEVRNRAKELLSQKSVAFQRSNPFLQIDKETLTDTMLQEEFVHRLSPEALVYSLKAIAPLVPEEAAYLNPLIAQGNTQAQKLYLFAYWAKQSSNHPEAAYKKYMEVVRAIDKLFHSGFRNGFETDRGIIYLRYGRPDDAILVEDEPSAPPYEIWSYNHFPATNQNNVRFLFYNPSLSPGNFELLHSTARGEINNPRWQIQLYRNAPTEIEGDDFISGTRMQDNFGRRALEYFNDF